MSEEKNTKELSVLYEQELERINKDPEAYMTPGARRYFKRVALGYVILAIAFSAGVWGITQRVDNQLRNQINDFLVVSCLNSITTIKKFNQGIEADIELQRDAMKINLSRGDRERVLLNQKTINAKLASKLHVPTKQECKDRKAF